MLIQCVEDDELASSRVLQNRVEGYVPLGLGQCRRRTMGAPCILVPSGVKKCLSRERDGAHGAGGVTITASAAGNGKANVECGVWTDECRGQVTIAGEDDCTGTLDDSIAWSQ